MAKKNTPRKNKKRRQSAKRGLPLKNSGRVKSSKRQNKSLKPKKLKSRKKTSAISEQLDGRQPKNKGSRQFSLQLSPTLFLEISFRRTKRPSKVAKRPLVSLRLKSKVTSVLLILLGLIGSIYFTFDLLQAAPEPPPVKLPLAPREIKVPSANVALATYTHSEPKALRIPSLNINTGFVTVGRLPDDTMEVPKTFNEAAWYRDSPSPGELGPAIIVGHVDSYEGPAVFWRLSQLLPEQIIEIDRADGINLKFEVNSVKQFEQDNFPAAEVYGNIDHAGLRIITCGGTFSHISNRYSHNTVVFASLIQ